MAKKNTGGTPKVLKLPISNCLNAPNRRAFSDLVYVSKQVAKAKNLAIRHWQRWREDHPDYEPSEAAVKQDGSPILDKNGNPLPDFPAGPRWFPSEFYPLCREFAPEVSASVMSVVGRRIADYLMGGAGKDKGKGQRVPYNHPGEATHIYQAILLGEVSSPSYKPADIPARASDVWLGYRGSVSAKVSPKNDRFRTLAKNHCILSVPIFSDNSGRKATRYDFLLNVGKFSVGQKKLLHRIVKGDIKLSDSAIYCKDGEFTFNICWKRERVVNEALRSDRVAILRPRPVLRSRRDPLRRDCYAFELELPNENGEGTYIRPIYNVLPYLQETEYTLSREKAIRRKRKVYGPKGRGRGYFYQTIAPLRINRNNVREYQFKLFISDVLRTASEEYCGVLEYHEPTKPTRNAREVLFNVYGLTFNWSDLPAQLRAKCEEFGVEFKCSGEKKKDNRIPQLSLKEWSKLVKSRKKSS